MSLEKYNQPLEDLSEAMKKHGLTNNEFVPLKHGNFLDLKFNSESLDLEYKTGFIEFEQNFLRNSLSYKLKNC